MSIYAPIPQADYTVAMVNRSTSNTLADVKTHTKDSVDYYIFEVADENKLVTTVFDGYLWCTLADIKTWMT